MNHQGVTRSKTDILLNKRAKIIDKVHLESNRLEKRLEKLARIHLSADNSNERFIHSNNNNVLLSPSSSIQSVSLDRADSVSSMDSSLGSVLSPKSSFVSNSNSILSMKLKYRDGEQSVTKWEDDKLVKKCPYCE
jgi:rabenosyn-5